MDTERASPRYSDMDAWAPLDIAEALIEGQFTAVAAASGPSPFTLPCLNEARRGGALTIGVANNRDTPILNGADHAIWLDTGAEPIAGSTRMKAGTAQRITVNVFASLVMILRGGVYD